MTISAGSDALASDFVSTSSGASDSGKVAKLDANGKIPVAFLPTKFGGTGADGALTVSSGTTTIALGSAEVFIKNYTSVSITGTGAVDFSGPASNGTLVIFRVTGNVTITSSATRALDLRGVGAAAATIASTFIFSGGTAGSQGGNGNGGGGAAGGAGSRVDSSTYTWHYTNTAEKIIRHGFAKYFIPGGGGANGGAQYSGTAGGAGGRGGGAFYMECNGAFNFASATIDISGQAGTNGPASTGGADSSGSGGGAGGNCGHMMILYNTLTANTGTVTASGGAGGTGGSSGGGANARTGGGGGGSTGGTQSAGASGGASGDPGAAGGNGGTGIGGGGGGGAGNSNGAGSGGAGGTGGADSTAYLITQNLWFT